MLSSVVLKVHEVTGNYRVQVSSQRKYYLSCMSHWGLSEKGRPGIGPNLAEHDHEKVCPLTLLVHHSSESRVGSLERDQ